MDKSTMEIGSTIDNCFPLPFELIYEILTWVPAKHLLRFKSVSKSCYNLINDPKFINLHLARSLEANSGSSFLLFYSTNDPSSYRIFSLCCSYQCHDVTQVSYPCHADERNIEGRSPANIYVVGSCHGLVCIRYAFNRFLIHNPTTRASKKLPYFNFKREHGVYDSTRILGFGYDCVSSDYKVLSCRYIDRSDGTTTFTEKRTRLYSLKTDAWEVVENPPWCRKLLIRCSPAFVNNSFHWLDPVQGEIIRCFHLSSRKYYEIPLPRTLCQNNPSSKLTVFEGQLCVVTTCFDIWILKEHGSKRSSWTQLFYNASQQNNLFHSKTLWYEYTRMACLRDWRNNFILIVTQGKFYGLSTLPALWIYCDVESNEITKMNNGITRSFPTELRLCSLQPWVESLVPLHLD